MTQNQIAYWNMQENRRHNLSTESLEGSKLNETKRHNVVTEGISSNTLDETRRHNVVQENVDISKMHESQRHNLVSEYATLKSLSESIRHNQSSENISKINNYLDAANSFISNLIANKRINVTEQTTLTELQKKLEMWGWEKEFENEKYVTSQKWKIFDEIKDTLNGLSSLKSLFQ